MRADRESAADSPCDMALLSPERINGPAVDARSPQPRETVITVCDVAADRRRRRENHAAAGAVAVVIRQEGEGR
ncbi:hypothetical protein [Streptomyces sp. NPDC048106]|uniref:hypothetical protein n=1 Tax=Streptomyces sp. NPDC048106 TaxID=3155750 RepID=UPI003455A64C